MASNWPLKALGMAMIVSISGVVPARLRYLAESRLGEGERRLRPGLVTQSRTLIAHVDLQRVRARARARRGPAVRCGGAIGPDDRPDPGVADHEAILRRPGTGRGRVQRDGRAGGLRGSLARGHVCGAAWVERVRKLRPPVVARRGVLVAAVELELTRARGDRGAA